MNKFRKVCRTLHREFGFLAVGLTLVYAVSGIAVNHAHHWDANYLRTVDEFAMEPVGTGPTTEIESVVLENLNLEKPIKSTWRKSETEFQVFLEGEAYDVDLVTGSVQKHGFARRPLFYDLNFMHLNSGKSPWTGIADAYAGLLIALSLTGIFLLKGRKGLAGRGGVMMTLGILLPVIYGVWMRTQG